VSHGGGDASVTGGDYVDFILAPDVYVNASVAPGTSPDRVVQRVLGKQRGQAQVTGWVLERVRGMLTSLPDFKPDAVEAQMKLITSLVQTIDGGDGFGPDAWREALVAGAHAASAKRVVTDHPDLLAAGEVDDIEFISTDAWLLEATTPPPTPGS